jgi:hypothetical protein
MSGRPWNIFTSTGGAAIPTEQSPSPTDEFRDVTGLLRALPLGDRGP